MQQRQSQLLLQIVFRIVMIAILMYPIVLICSTNEDKREKGYVMITSLFVYIFPALVLGVLCTGLWWFVTGEYWSQYSFTLLVQFLSSFLLGGFMVYNVFATYSRVFEKGKSIYHAILYTFIGLVGILYIYSGLSALNENLVYLVFDDADAEIYIEALKLERQLLSMSSFPIALALLTFFLNIIVFITKPITSLTARIIYAIESNNLINQKKYLLLLAIFLCSFLIKPFKKIIELIEIGL